MYPGQRFGMSAVLPAYNEAGTLPGTILELAAVLDGLVGERFEIIVVDDGSTDGTGRVLDDLRGQWPHLPVRVIRHERRRGYAAALAAGLDGAGYELLFFTDADGQYEVRELASLLDALDDGTHLVIGYRARRVGSLLRRVGGWSWNWLVNDLLGCTVRDVECAFKLLRREVWRTVRVDARGATFSAELIGRARRQGFGIKELPVSYFPRQRPRPRDDGAPRRRLEAAGGGALVDLLRLRKRLGRVDRAQSFAPREPVSCQWQDGPAAAPRQ